MKLCMPSVLTTLLILGQRAELPQMLCQNCLLFTEAVKEEKVGGEEEEGRVAEVFAEVEGEVVAEACCEFEAVDAKEKVRANKTEGDRLPR